MVVQHLTLRTVNNKTCRFLCRSPFISTTPLELSFETVNSWSSLKLLWAGPPSQEVVMAKSIQATWLISQHAVGLALHLILFDRAENPKSWSLAAESCLFFELYSATNFQSQLLPQYRVWRVGHCLFVLVYKDIVWSCILIFFNN